MDGQNKRRYPTRQLSFCVVRTLIGHFMLQLVVGLIANNKQLNLFFKTLICRAYYLKLPPNINLYIFKIAWI